MGVLGDERSAGKVARLLAAAAGLAAAVVVAAPASAAPAGQVKAGVAKVDATWHVGASAGQYAS